MDSTINVNYNNKKATVSTPVADSLNASVLADRLNSLPYAKVYDRSFENGRAIIKLYIIKAIFTYEKFQEDLDSMKNLMNIEQ